MGEFITGRGQVGEGNFVQIRGQLRQASKSTNCSNLPLDNAGDPTVTCECVPLRWKDAILRATRRLSSLKGCASPAASPRQAPGWRWALRRLPLGGTQAICYIKQNSNHTRVPADPQRRTRRETRSSAWTTFFSFWSF